jgi:hypothetical protein
MNRRQLFIGEFRLLRVDRELAMTRKWSVPFISFIMQIPLPALARNDLEKEVVMPAYLFSSPLVW